MFAFGDAQFYGSMGNQHLNEPVVGMQPTRDGKGYWLVAADGGIFNYGDAQFYGSTGNIHLNSPIVGMVATNDGLGYFLVAADGGVFAFGDARSPVAATRTRPARSSDCPPPRPVPVTGWPPPTAVSSATATPGSMDPWPTSTWCRPSSASASTTDGGGYWLVASDGGIFAFGNAIYDGSTGNEVLNSPMISMADI